MTKTMNALRQCMTYNHFLSYHRINHEGNKRSFRVFHSSRMAWIWFSTISHPQETVNYQSFSCLIHIVTKCCLFLDLSFIFLFLFSFSHFKSRILVRRNHSLSTCIDVIQFAVFSSSSSFPFHSFFHSTKRWTRRINHQSNTVVDIHFPSLFDILLIYQFLFSL